MSLKKLAQIGIGLLLGCLTLLAQSQEAVTVRTPLPVVIDDLHTPHNLSPHLQFFEDADHQYTIADVQAGRHDQLWQQVKGAYFLGQNPNSKYWLRISYEWRGNAAATAVLMIPNHSGLLTHIGLILPNADGSSRTINTGHLEPFATRDYQSHQFGFAVPLLPNQPLTILAWVSNRDIAMPAMVPLYLMSEQQFDDANNFLNGLLIAFYAVLGAMLIYNLSLFLSLWQPVYGIYVIFMLIAMLTCATLDGTSLRWWLPESPILNYRIGTCNGVALGMAHLTFVVFALDTFIYLPAFKKMYALTMFLGLASMIYTAIGDNSIASGTYAQTFGAGVVPVILVPIIYGVIKRAPTAGYVMVAELVTLAGSISFMLMIQNAAPINAFTFWGLHWGFLGEAILLSLALAARTRIAQQQAIRYLNNYQTLYEQAVEGLFEYDLSNHSVHANKAFAQLFGYASVDTLPTVSNPLLLFSGEDRQTIPELLERDGIIAGYEAVIEHPISHENLWVLISMRLVLDEKQKPIRIDGSMQNVTARKQKEALEKEKLVAEQERKAAEMASEAKSQFFASISHELRTPLTAILGYAEIGLRRSLSHEEKEQKFQTIRKSGRHLLQLVNDILDLSKIEAHKLEVEIIDVNLVELLNEVNDYISILSLDKGLIFSINYQLPFPETIQSDPTRLKQILINLCGNSVKFTDKGGVTLQVSCEPTDEQLRFSIKDSGIGMKAEHVEKLFQAYVQADASITRNFGGTGLGLYLSKQIAEQLGGTIVVESAFGKGSTFTVTIAAGKLSDKNWLTKLPTSEITPTQKSAVVEDHSQTVHLPPKTNANFRVLLAEDNPVNQQLVAFHIKQSGAEAVIAKDGVEALAYALTKNIDLVLIDMEMPIMGGLEAVEKLRMKHFNKPIYALTANESEKAIMECLAAGCNGHLSKPLNTEKLMSVLRDHINSSLN